MNHFFTKTFNRFLIGFLTILVVSFGVLVFAEAKLSEPQPRPIDNIALPQ